MVKMDIRYQISDIRYQKAGADTQDPPSKNEDGAPGAGLEDSPFTAGPFGVTVGRGVI